MKTINYKIVFHTYWHCGSGLAAGADVDALTIKDKNGIPYIPGKTVKGLLREAVDSILSIGGNVEASEEYLKVFGYYDDNSDKDVSAMKKSDVFFSNATIDEYDKVNGFNLQKHLYSSISSTAIDGKTGIAMDHTLRKIEVVVPCSLSGSITDVPESMVGIILDAMKFIKNMGTNRNRGLGRCTFEGKEE